MNKYHLSALSIILACLTLASANHNFPDGRSFQKKKHDINQVEMYVSNYGNFGQRPSGGPGLWWPIGSAQNYIYGAGLWFGSIDSATCDTLVTNGLNLHTGSFELGPGLEGMATSDTNARIFMYPDDWPPPQGVFPMAPQTRLSHQDSWCCFNDCDSALHVPGDTRPIGIEIYQTVYVWNLWPIEDVAFLTYECKNVSGHRLYDCFFGFPIYCVIGNPSGTQVDDRISGFLVNPYFIDSVWYIADNIGYQWQENPEAGWSTFPGVIGFDMLQTPFDLVPGQDKDSDGILDQYEQDSAYYVVNLPPFMWDVDMDNTPDWRDASENPQLGMTAFKHFNIGFIPETDPQCYMTLAGYNCQTGAYEPFDTVPPDPNEPRFVMSSGPFDLGVDESVTLALAIVLADWYEGHIVRPDTALIIPDYWAQHVYDHSWRIFDIEERTANDKSNSALRIFPNPAKWQSIVRFTLAEPGPVALKLYDVSGQLVRTIDDGHWQAGAHDVRLDLQGLSAGTYFTVLQTPLARQVQKLVIVKMQ